MGLARRRDRRVVWLRKVETAETLGRTVSWVEFSESFVALTPVGGRENLRAGAVQDDVAFIATAPYRVDITTDVRARFGGVDYEIAARREVGRRRGWELDFVQVRS